MNQESVFALRFVVKDIAKMRKAMESVNENLRKMQENANKTTKGFDKVNTSLGKATRSLLRFGLTYFAVSKIINNVFSSAHKTIQAGVMALTAGVEINQIKRLGRAVEDFGGDVRSAGSAYANMTNIIGGARHGFGISEDIERVNAMFGIGFNYGNITQDQLLTQIAKSMNRLKGQGNQWGINQIASAYGLDESMAAMLAQYGAGWKKHVSKQDIDNTSMSEAQRLIKSQKDLETKIQTFMNKARPLLTKLIESLTKIANYIETITPENTTEKFDDPNLTSKKNKNGTRFITNKKTGEYTIMDSDLNTLYQGKNLLKANDVFNRATYNPNSWLNQKLDWVRDKLGIKDWFYNFNGIKQPTQNVTINTTVNTTSDKPKEIGKEVGKSVAKTFNSPRSNTI